MTITTDLHGNGSNKDKDISSMHKTLECVIGMFAIITSGYCTRPKP